MTEWEGLKLKAFEYNLIYCRDLRFKEFFYLEQDLEALYYMSQEIRVGQREVL